MATEKRLTRSRAKEFEKVCTPLKKLKTSNESMKCSKKDNTSSSASTHTLAEHIQVEGDKQEEHCNVHPTMIVDKNCEKHDTVCGATCFSTNHSSCSDLHDIQDIPESTIKGRQFSDMTDEVDTTIAEMEAMTGDYRDVKEKLKSTKEACVRDIETYMTQLKMTIDRLGKASFSELDKRYTELDSKFKDEMKTVDEITEFLKTRKKEMESSEEDIKQRFAKDKHCQNRLTEAKKIRSNTVLKQDVGLTFSRNLEISFSLMSNDSLSVKQEKSDHIPTFSANSVGNKQPLYKIKSLDKVNVKLQAHRYDKVEIWSMCVLDSGNVLLANRQISALSVLDHKTYEVRSVLCLPARPHSVCKVNSEEVVIALENQTLQFISIQEDQFVQTRSIELDHLCLGIDVVLDQIYVTSGRTGHIYIYDLHGTFVKKIENEPNGNKIFGWNRFIIVGEAGDTMHVTDREKCVITLDKEGNVIWGHTVPGVASAFGICKDGKGNLFVTGIDSNNVSLVGQDGKYQGEVIPSQRCVVKPEAVCFDTLNSKLYVSGLSCDEVYVYTLH